MLLEARTELPDAKSREWLMRAASEQMEIDVSLEPGAILPNQPARASALEGELRSLCRAIDLAVFFGARSIRVAAGNDDPACLDRIVPWFRRGTEYAAARGLSDIVVRSDSELLVKQMRGEYRVKNTGLQPLHARASLLVRRIGRVRFEHVRRAQNAEADALANRAMDRARESGVGGRVSD